MNRGALLFLITLLSSTASAQELTPDPHTLLLLHFNNDLAGSSGESPTQSSGVAFEAGRFGSGAYFPAGNQLQYSASGNIDSRHGTLEFWIKPRWSSSDGQGHFAFKYGVAGGMLFGKDGGNFWRMILNRFGSGGPETGCGLQTQWQANQWHHAAFTWSSQSLKLFLDGQLMAQAPVTGLNSVSASTLQIGADGTSSQLDAVLDELRISDVDRSDDEIRSSFLAGITTVSSLVFDANALEMVQTWTRTLSLTAQTDFGTLPLPSAAASWNSANPSVATVDASGRITAIAQGTAVITATFRGQQAHATITVKAPVLSPRVEAIDPLLSTPAAGAIFDVPVVIVRYLPTKNGVNLDEPIAGTGDTIAKTIQQIDRYDIETKFMLEEGSRFRGYKTPQARPSLGYRVLYLISFFEEMPAGFSAGVPGIFFPDYNQILTRIDARHFVNDLGVKEFWIWGYHNGNIAPVESNMSSPTTGDISNSFRIADDLPVFNSTFTLYNYNFTRSSNEAVHNHGHQLEAILAYVNQLQDGNQNLFWNQFVGRDADGHFITGRSGWTHMPPNTTSDYDYANPTLVQSDIEDWTPAGSGQKRLVSASTWTNLFYPWPRGNPEDLTQHQWYMYWMQNMPGLDNRIPYGDQKVMTNWWAFTGNWDAAIRSKLGLYQTTTPPRRRATRH